MNFENKAELGKGVYTITDVARILNLKRDKVSRWIKTFWDGKLGTEYGRNYSWSNGVNRAVSFHTMIEIYVFYQFNEMGVTPKKLLAAHQQLVEEHQTPFPFAQEKILKNIGAVGKKLVHDSGDGNVYSLDKSKQYYLELIRAYVAKIDFGDDLIASRFWPLGREVSVLCDPERKFGQPIMGVTNIYPETLYGMYKAGEPINFIALVYEIPEQYVHDAITYCKAA